MRVDEPVAAGGPGRNALQYRLGGRIRELRLREGLSMSALAARVGITPSAMSQIETGSMQPSVSRLVEIVGAMGVPLSAAFDEDVLVSFPPPYDGAPASEPFESVFVARADDATPLDLGEGVVYRRIGPRGIPGVEFFESVYPPGASSGPEGSLLAHSGAETGWVTSGRLVFQFREGEVELGGGDSIGFPASKGHRILNRSGAVAVATWLTVTHVGRS